MIAFPKVRYSQLTPESDTDSLPEKSATTSRTSRFSNRDVAFCPPVSLPMTGKQKPTSIQDTNKDIIIPDTCAVNPEHIRIIPNYLFEQTDGICTTISTTQSSTTQSSTTQSSITQSSITQSSITQSSTTQSSTTQSSTTQSVDQKPGHTTHNCLPERDMTQPISATQKAQLDINMKLAYEVTTQVCKAHPLVLDKANKGCPAYKTKEKQIVINQASNEQITQPAHSHFRASLIDLVLTPSSVDIYQSLLESAKKDTPLKNSELAFLIAFKLKQTIAKNIEILKIIPPAYPKAMTPHFLVIIDRFDTDYIRANQKTKETVFVEINVNPNSFSDQAVICNPLRNCFFPAKEYHSFMADEFLETDVEDLQWKSICIISRNPDSLILMSSQTRATESAELKRPVVGMS